MAVSRWVYRTSDGLFVYGGFYDPPSPVKDADGNDDWTGHALVEFPDAEPQPNKRTERYDAASPTKKRAATAQEIADYDAGAGETTTTGVDAKTRERIRALVDADAPVDQQLAYLRRLFFADWAYHHGEWPDGRKITHVERNAAHAFLVEQQHLHEKIESLVNEGRGKKTRLL